jgi:hypothetical protein
VLVLDGGGGGSVGRGGCVVGGGLGTAVVVGLGTVPIGGRVVGDEVVGGAVVVGSGGGRSWAPACHMAAAAKAMVDTTTIPAARQRALTG